MAAAVAGGVLGGCWYRITTTTTTTLLFRAGAAAAAYYQPHRLVPQRHPFVSSRWISHRSRTGSSTAVVTTVRAISRSALDSEPSQEGRGEGDAATAAASPLPPPRPAASSARQEPPCPHHHPHHQNHFVAPPWLVYIEDTDDYGVIYNGNYLRAYDRALHTMTTTTSSSSEDMTKYDEGVCGGSGVRHLDDSWSIVSVQELKFRAPPPLGGVYCIEGTRRKTPNDNESDRSDSTTTSRTTTTTPSASLSEVWDLVMRSPDGSTIYNTATGVTISRPPPTNPDASNTATTTDSSAAATWLPVPL